MESFAKFVEGMCEMRIGHRASNADLRLAHMKSLEEQDAFLRQPHVAFLNSTGTAKPPSRKDTASAMASCTPIFVTDLHVGTTHKGRLLRGTITVSLSGMGA